MKKFSIKYTNMTSEDLDNTLISTNDINEKYNILKEAYRRKDSSIILSGASNNFIMSNESTASMIIKYSYDYLREKNNDIFEIMYSVLNTPKEILESNGTKDKIKVICLSDAKISALALLCEGTPNNIIDSIVNLGQLNNCKKNVKVTSENISLKQINEYGEKVLINIIQLTREDYKLNNAYTGYLFLPRLVQNPNDYFMSEIAKANLDPSTATGFLEASKQLTNAKKFKDNLQQNKSSGILLAKNITSDIPIETIISNLINIVLQEGYQCVQWIWKFLNEKISIDKRWIDLALDVKKNNMNLLVEMSKTSENIMINIFDYLTSNFNKDRLITEPAFRDIVKLMFNNPILRQNVLSLPNDLLINLKLPRDVRKQIEDAMKPITQTHDEDDEDIAKLLG